METSTLALTKLCVTGELCWSRLSSAATSPRLTPWRSSRRSHFATLFKPSLRDVSCGTITVGEPTLPSPPETGIAVGHVPPTYHHLPLIESSKSKINDTTRTYFRTHAAASCVVRALTRSNCNVKRRSRPSKNYPGTELLIRSARHVADTN